MAEEKKYKGKVLTRRLVFLLIVLVFSVFLLLGVLMSKESFNVLTDSFNRISVGISALVAVLFGPSLVERELEKDRKIKEYLERYPHEKFPTDWEIIQSDKHMGAIYLLDKKDKSKHHILNMKTVYDLGWHIYSRTTISDALFQSYKVGDRIRTQGEAGE